MNKHLPECPVNKRLSWFRQKCICPALCACEQRVEAEWLARYNYDPDLVWEDALDVARQAVKAIWPTEDIQALDAAIDSLQDETKEYVYRSSWSAALDAAREAVAALDIGRDVRFSVDVKADALAAIDALRLPDKP